jgi:hypothetical protein
MDDSIRFFPDPPATAGKRKKRKKKKNRFASPSVKAVLLLRRPSLWRMPSSRNLKAHWPPRLVPGPEAHWPTLCSRTRSHSQAPPSNPSLGSRRTHSRSLAPRSAMAGAGSLIALPLGLMFFFSGLIINALQVSADSSLARLLLGLHDLGQSSEPASHRSAC